MHWMESLCKLHMEKESEINFDDVDACVAPYMHQLQIMHANTSKNITSVEVELDVDGNLMGAAMAKTSYVMPITEGSCQRGSKANPPEPHPIIEQVKWCLECNSKGHHAKLKDVDMARNGARRAQYSTNLKMIADWAFDNGYKKESCVLNAILKYVRANTAMASLMSSEPRCMPNTMIKWVVRFEDGPYSVWKSHAMIKMYQEYINSTSAVSYVVAPKYIRYGGDKGKIISSNRDGDNDYVFRGMYSSANQALQLTREEVQRSHNALKWLCKNQSINIDGLSIVMWKNSNAALDICLSDLLNDGVIVDDEPDLIDTGEGIFRKVRSLSKGYHTDISGEDADGMYLLGLDSVVPGRLSIVVNDRLKESAILNNIRLYHKDYKWKFTVFVRGADKDGLYKIVEGARAIDGIINSIYGVANRNGKIEYVEKGSVLKSYKLAILKAILLGKSIDERLKRDAIESFIKKASLGYPSTQIREVLEVACSLCNGNAKRKGMDMENSRGHLYGRALAVAHYCESIYYKKKDISRATVAERHMRRYRDRPLTTLAEITTKLKSQCLSGSSMGWLNRLYDKYHSSILSEIDSRGFSSNDPLDDGFIIGYYAQLSQLREPKPQTTTGEN